MTLAPTAESADLDTQQWNRDFRRETAFNQEAFATPSHCFAGIGQLVRPIMDSSASG
ncbi:protein of unknown function [Methylocaldum szegediense]|jgi:hypothetical protein|uniref:Uncharacterized protein n=1 Tax=Methylocaldum szegediense TaxID=73780 RepID=A0ABM9I2C3_9GAMM|nr:protein of unknown function [Methylocaldum szegediense]